MRAVEKVAQGQDRTTEKLLEVSGDPRDMSGRPRAPMIWSARTASLTAIWGCGFLIPPFLFSYLLFPLRLVGSEVQFSSGYLYNE